MSVLQKDKNIIKWIRGNQHADHGALADQSHQILSEPAFLEITMFWGRKWINQSGDLFV